MEDKFIAETSVVINADESKVWEAITSPALIKQYLMGAEVTTDWKEGSPISYEGQYNGEKYHDKGIIKKIVPNGIFQSTYWSSAGGKEDKPENYHLVTYTLSPWEEKTIVVLTQDNIHSKKEQEHVTANWEAVLDKLKRVVEAM